MQEEFPEASRPQQGLMTAQRFASSHNRGKQSPIFMQNLSCFYGRISREAVQVQRSRVTIAFILLTSDMSTFQDSLEVPSFALCLPTQCLERWSIRKKTVLPPSLSLVMFI